MTGFEGYQFEHPTPGEGPAWVLSLEGHWLEGRAERRGGCLSFKPEKFFVGGMSGSPIVDAAGPAVGVILVDLMSPVVADALSTQLLQSIRDASKADNDGEVGGSDEDAEIEAILAGPPSAVSPPAPISPPNLALREFDQAIGALKRLMTKSTAQFVKSIHSGDDLEGIESFIHKHCTR